MIPNRDSDGHYVDLDKKYSLPIEIAMAITKAWRQTQAAATFVEQLASISRCGNARETAIPQMPTTTVPQEPGPPSDPIRDLIAAIGAVAKVFTPKEIRADPAAQHAMDVEYRKPEDGGTLRKRTLNLGKKFEIEQRKPE